MLKNLLLELNALKYWMLNRVRPRNHPAITETTRTRLLLDRLSSIQLKTKTQCLAWGTHVKPLSSPASPDIYLLLNPPHHWR